MLRRNVKQIVRWKCSGAICAIPKTKISHRTLEIRSIRAIVHEHRPGHLTTMPGHPTICAPKRAGVEPKTCRMDLYALGIAGQVCRWGGHGLESGRGKNIGTTRKPSKAVNSLTKS